VPLKLVTWEYKTAAERIQSGQSSFDADPKDFRLTMNQPPNPIEENWAGGPGKYPQWNKNISVNGEAKECGVCK
jgi:hypothetical protein